MSSAAKAVGRPAPKGAGEDVGGARPERAAPTGSHAQGSAWARVAAGPSDGPGSGRPSAREGPYQGPSHASGAPTSSPGQTPRQTQLVTPRKPWGSRVSPKQEPLFSPKEVPPGAGRTGPRPTFRKGTQGRVSARCAGQGAPAADEAAAPTRFRQDPGCQGARLNPHRPLPDYFFTSTIEQVFDFGYKTDRKRGKWHELQGICWVR